MSFEENNDGKCVSAEADGWGVSSQQPSSIDGNARPSKGKTKNETAPKKEWDDDAWDLLNQ